MTYGLYAGISAADLGYEPDLPVCDCPKCDGAVYIARRGRGLICSVCLMEYDSMADIATAEAYYLEQWDEMQSGYAGTVAEGLERWQR